MRCKECGFDLSEAVLVPDESLKVTGIVCPRCFVTAMSKRAAELAGMQAEVSNAR